MPNNRRIMKTHIEIIEAFGGTSAVAEYVGVKPPSVSEWKTNGRIPVGSLAVLAPELEFRGICSRKELFPNDWQKRWPEIAHHGSKEAA